MTSSLVLLVFTLGVLYQSGNHIWGARMSSAYFSAVEYETEQYRGADEWLSEIGIPENARVLVYATTNHNLPLIQCGRDGYSIVHTSPELVENKINRAWDYVITTKDKIWTELRTVAPDFLSQLKFVDQC